MRKVNPAANCTTPAAWGSLPRLDRGDEKFTGKQANKQTNKTNPEPLASCRCLKHPTPRWVQGSQNRGKARVRQRRGAREPGLPTRASGSPRVRREPTGAREAQASRGPRSPARTPRGPGILGALPHSLDLQRAGLNLHLHLVGGAGEQLDGAVLAEALPVHLVEDRAIVGLDAQRDGEAHQAGQVPHGWAQGGRAGAAAPGGGGERGL